MQVLALSYSHYPHSTSEPFLGRAFFVPLYKRSLGSTSDLTAIAVVRCQHAEACSVPLKSNATNNKWQHVIRTCCLINWMLVGLIRLKHSRPDKYFWWTATLSVHRSEVHPIGLVLPMVLPQHETKKPKYARWVFLSGRISKTNHELSM